MNIPVPARTMAVITVEIAVTASHDKNTSHHKNDFPTNNLNVVSTV
jgi:hypothetical protein